MLTFNDVHEANVGGIVPVNKFDCIRNSPRFSKILNSVGMIPVNRLYPKLTVSIKWVGVGMRVPRLYSSIIYSREIGERVPRYLLKFEIRPSSVGIVPLKAAPEISKFTVWI